MATKHNNPYADKAADDEPLFTLRAQDKLAAMVVRYWAEHAEDAGTPAHTIEKALRCADEMDAWLAKKGPD